MTSVLRRIDKLRAPLLVSWQLTRDCDLACLHCCTESAPGKKLPDELGAAAAVRVAAAIAAGEVPYVMLCGGEPLIVPWFFAVAQVLADAGVALKIETNGQQLNAAVARRLARLPIRSVQVSLDADTQEVFGQQRIGGSLERAHDACREIRAAGLPLEVTFAPTRINIHELEAVIDRAAGFGAFRFNTGRLMRIGTAARLWDRLCPDGEQYRVFRERLDRRRRQQDPLSMELAYEPFSMTDGLRDSLAQPPATLLILPNGQVKVAAALPFICADLRTDSLGTAWLAYRRAWKDSGFTHTVADAINDETRHAAANRWHGMREVIHSIPLETT